MTSTRICQKRISQGYRGRIVSLGPYHTLLYLILTQKLPKHLFNQSRQLYFQIFGSISIHRLSYFYITVNHHEKLDHV